MNKDEIKKDIEKYVNLEMIGSSEAGKELIYVLEESFVSLIDKLVSKPRVGTEDLYSIIAELDVTLNMMRMLSRAAKNKELALQALKDEESRELS